MAKTIMTQNTPKKGIAFVMAAFAFISCLLICWPAPGMAQEQASLETAESTWPSAKEIKQSQIQANKRLQASLSMSGQTPPDEHLSRERSLLRDIEAVYGRQMTALEQNTSLNKQLKDASDKTGIAKEAGPGKPPYQLNQYDKLLDDLNVWVGQEETARLAYKSAQKNLEDARDRLDTIEQRARALKEKTQSKDSHDTTVMVNAGLENILAKQVHVLQGIEYENYRLKLEIALSRKIKAEDKSLWVRSHLRFDPDELETRIADIKKKRSELKKLIEKLANNQHLAKNAWIMAQKEIEQISPDNEKAMSRAQALIDRQKALQETCQKRLEQAEGMLKMLNQEEKIWRHRYTLIQGNVDSETISSWKAEDESYLSWIERMILLQDKQQTDLQSQISTIQKKLGDKAIDRKVKRHGLKHIEALNVLADSRFEYLTALQSSRELGNRLLDECAMHRKDLRLDKKLKDMGSRLNGLWQYELWVVDDHPVTIKKIILALVLLFIGLRIAKGIRRSLNRRFLPRTRLDKDAQSAIERVVYYFLLLVIVLYVFKVINIPLTVFTFLGGAIAIGVGFGAQNLINNFISGFIILIEQPIKIDDIVEIEGNFGKIEKIGARCTHIRTFDNIQIIVPNSSFLEKNIVNWTLNDQIVRSRVEVGVAYGSDTRQVSRLMTEAAQKHDKILKNPPPYIYFNSFGDNALIFNLYFWSLFKDSWMTKSDVRFIIDRLFAQAGIVISFPQTDIHLDDRPIKLQISQEEKE
ncbi:MAG: mechanosensitive ion channel [Thermodesulfobacteriota bacterium]|nr:mechanosensitive ion channel [Thermodesulfobacteriota bacterium]